MKETAMGRQDADGTTVLVVEDEPDLRELYAMMLGEAYDVMTAADGEEALAVLDESIDVALLDRRMPDMTGDEALSELRARGYEIPVAMLSAVDPDTDIVEMPFDDYVTKPADKEELLTTVEILTNRAQFDETSREFYRLASKKAVLEAEDEVDHTTSQEYQRLVDRMEDLRADITETLDDLLDADSDAAFRSL